MNDFAVTERIDRSVDVVRHVRIEGMRTRGRRAKPLIAVERNVHYAKERQYCQKCLDLGAHHGNSSTEPASMKEILQTGLILRSRYMMIRTQ